MRTSPPVRVLPKPRTASGGASQSVSTSGSGVVIDILKSLDQPVVDALRAGDIRLIRVSWLCALTPRKDRVFRCDELEALEISGEASPFLQPGEAAELLQRGNRAVGVVSHGWLSPADCDPCCSRLEVLQAALMEARHIEGIFWDQQSLPQRPRNDRDEARFRRALTVMALLFGSVVGTTVLQIKDVPQRPREYDGAIALRNLRRSLNEEAIRDSFSRPISSVTFDGPLRQRLDIVVVRFRSHDAAQASLDTARELAGAADLLYNERSYDGQQSGGGSQRSDDQGRGWCCFEDAVSMEIIVRLQTYPQVQTLLSNLPPKMLSLRSDEPFGVVKIEDDDLASRIGRVLSRIDRATFNRVADQQMVRNLYIQYVERIAGVLQERLALAFLADSGSIPAPLPLPEFAPTPKTEPLRLAQPQLMLLLPDLEARRTGGEGTSQLGVVDESGAKIKCIPDNGQAMKLSFDACSQAVMPWQYTTDEWSTKLMLDAHQMVKVHEQAERLYTTVQVLGTSSLEVLRMANEADEAVTLMRQAKVLRQHADLLRGKVSSSMVATNVRSVSEQEALARSYGDGPTDPRLHGIHEAMKELYSTAKEVRKLHAAVVKYVASMTEFQTKISNNLFKHVKDLTSKSMHQELRASLDSAKHLFSSVPKIQAVDQQAFEMLFGKQDRFGCAEKSLMELEQAANACSIARHELRETKAAVEDAATWQATVKKDVQTRRAEWRSLIADRTPSPEEEKAYSADEARLKLELDKVLQEVDNCQKLERQRTRTHSQANKRLQFHLDSLQDVCAALAIKADPLGFDSDFVAKLEETTRKLHKNAQSLTVGSLDEAARFRQLRIEAGQVLKVRNSTSTAKITDADATEASDLLAKSERSIDENLDLVIPALREAILKLRLGREPATIAAAALQACRARGMRSYAVGQMLSVFLEGRWQDARVQAAGAKHLLRVQVSEIETEVALHPWNHAPRQLPSSTFELLRDWYLQSQRRQHMHVIDVVSGKQLDVCEQCVAIKFSARDESKIPAEITDVQSLSGWLLKLHLARRSGATTNLSYTLGSLHGAMQDEQGVGLLTAPPAAGKTTLMSQLVTLQTGHEPTELIPILIKVHRLHMQLQSEPSVFASSWNWFDAYLRLEHSSNPEVYRMLRQVMIARHALLLLDGLDEAGESRDALERHVTEVIRPQGHLVLCSCRDAGVSAERFSGFYRLELSPLSGEQQEEALVRRLGKEDASKLLPFLQSMPSDPETEQPSTSCPLVLSMVISVFELRQCIVMPQTKAELYASASNAILTRGGVTSTDVRRLLQSVCFQAHNSQCRVIEDRHLDEAALALEGMEMLADIRQKALRGAPLNQARSAVYLNRLRTLRDAIGDAESGVARQGARMAHVDGSGAVRVVDVRAVHLDDVSTGGKPYYTVGFEDGSERSTEAASLYALPVHGDLHDVSIELGHVAEHVNFLRNDEDEDEGEKPQPLRRRGIVSECMAGGYHRITFFDNGSQSGWLKASDVETSGMSEIQFVLHAMERSYAEVLDACRNLSAGLRNALVEVRGRVVRDELPLFSLLDSAPLRMCASHLSFQEYMAAEALCEEGTHLTGAPPWKWPIWWANTATMGEEMGTPFGQGLLLATHTQGKTLDLRQRLGGDQLTALRASMQLMGGLTHLDISQNALGHDAAKVLAQQLAHNTVLTCLMMERNPIGDEGAIAIGQSLESNRCLQMLGMSKCTLSKSGAQGLAKGIQNHAAMLRFNLDGHDLPVQQLKGSEPVEALDLAGTGLGFLSGIVIGALIQDNGTLKALLLQNNFLGPQGGCAIAEGLKNNPGITKVDLQWNVLDNKSAKKLQAAATERRTRPRMRAFTLLA